MSFKCINIHSSSALRVLCLSSFPSLVLCLAAQSSPIVCDSTDCSPPGSSIHGDSPGKNTEVGCHTLFQGLFPTQGSNPDLPHCRQILYHLSPGGSPLRYQGSPPGELSPTWASAVLGLHLAGAEPKLLRPD